MQSAVLTHIQAIHDYPLLLLTPYTLSSSLSTLGTENKGFCQIEKEIDYCTFGTLCK